MGSQAASSAFTLTEYSHVLPGLQAEAAARLDGIFAADDAETLANG
jgi:hypothetical protein